MDERTAQDMSEFLEVLFFQTWDQLVRMDRERAGAILARLHQEMKESEAREGGDQDGAENPDPVQ